MVAELFVELKLGPGPKLEDVEPVVDSEVETRRAEKEDPSTKIIPLDSDIRGDDGDDVTADGEDNVLSDDEDDKVTGVTLPSFDPMENKL